eukprot:CAMPEP_0180820486 /NCGR_PEP_ID=MMETSP1038_2-20121128/70309_1 /TAXON_ID=632150 /ORGANISM="Azadinium spinosum, Strain 3D9" /LENGTH=90 /DNA_ID=CAMNT_0022862577 /DNA_START=9 /DNA_END=278 /DNA_ORIENTATION=-
MTSQQPLIRDCMTELTVGGKDDGHGQHFVISEALNTVLSIYVVLLHRPLNTLQAKIRYETRGSIARVAIGGKNEVIRLSGMTLASATALG